MIQTPAATSAATPPTQPRMGSRPTPLPFSVGTVVGAGDSGWLDSWVSFSVSVSSTLPKMAV